MKKLIKTTLIAAVFAGTAFAQDAGRRDNPEAKKGPRDNPEAKREGPRDGEKPRVPVDRQRQKDGKIFVAYDKDKSGTVTAKEIEGMREGRLDARQRKQITDMIEKADKNKDGELSLEEWFVYMDVRRNPGREGGDRRGGERDAPDRKPAERGR